MSVSRGAGGTRTVRSPTRAAITPDLLGVFSLHAAHAAHLLLLLLLGLLRLAACAAHSFGVGNRPRGGEQHREREEQCANQLHRDLLCFVCDNAIRLDATVTIGSTEVNVVWKAGLEAGATSLNQERGEQTERRARVARQQASGHRDGGRGRRVLTALRALGVVGAEYAVSVAARVVVGGADGLEDRRRAGEPPQETAVLGRQERQIRKLVATDRDAAETPPIRSTRPSPCASAPVQMCPWPSSSTRAAVRPRERRPSATVSTKSW